VRGFNDEEGAMTTGRRHVLALVVLALAAASGAAHAQNTTWPQRPVRLIVPLAPGGSVDMVARMLAARLSEEFGQQFVVDNRGGAGGTIGATIVARAEPDGHTLLMLSGAFASSAALYKLPYDPIKSFAPIGMIAAGPLFLTVHPSVKAADLKAFIELARGKSAILNYGSGGIGSTTHMATEYLQQMSATAMTHVPYKGIGAAISDLLSGQLQMYLAPGAAVFPHVATGRLRILGQSSERRLPTMPELPAIAEVVPGYAASFPYSMGAPAGTPAQIVSRINAALARTLKQAEIVERLRSFGLEPAHSTPREHAQAIVRDIAMWTKVVKTARIKLE
jgi:tripartite-type tricarboxylate transporter receptor subunit TctC